MPLPNLNLDDKTFKELVEEAKKYIPIYAPEWTDHGIHDPGITLIELFAWISEMQLYYLSKITEENKLSFLKILGVLGEDDELNNISLVNDDESEDSIILKTSSNEDVEFDGDIILPNRINENKDLDFTISEVRKDIVKTYSAVTPEDYEYLVHKYLKNFSRKKQQDDELVIGIKTAETEIYQVEKQLNLKNTDINEKDSGLIYPDSCFYNNTLLNTEKDNIFYPFGDEPKKHDNFYIASKNGFSKKNELIEIQFTFDNRKEYGDILLSYKYWNGNVWNTLNIKNDSFSTLGCKCAILTFTCPSDIKPLEVNGNTNYWIKIELLSDCYIKSSTSKSTKYNPPSISEIKIVLNESNDSYSLENNTLTNFKSSNLSETIENELLSNIGENKSQIKEIKEEKTEEKQYINDFRVKAIPDVNNKLMKVIIAQKIDSNSNKNYINYEDSDLYEYVFSCLDKCRLVGTPLYVGGPEFVEVSISADINVKKGYNIGSVKNKVEDTLKNFLHPFKGGILKKGWPFGRNVFKSEIYKLLTKVDGIKCVQRMDIYSSNNNCSYDGGNLLIPDNGLVYSQNHSISANSSSYCKRVDINE